ncbi:MAG: FixH family protein [Phycisphaerales bacterium]
MIAQAARIPAAAPAGGKKWIAMIFSLIGLNMCIVGATVYFAVSDKTVAVEPDYYAKAIAYDDVIAQRSENSRLGWKTTPTLLQRAGQDNLELSVTVSDRDGAPLRGANIQVVLFPNLRAQDRQTLKLSEVATTPGSYSAPCRMIATGTWRIRTSIRRGDSVFTNERDVAVTPVRGEGR